MGAPDRQPPLLSVRGFRLSGMVDDTEVGRRRMGVFVPTLDVHPGEVSAVIGGSGCGKSVLLSLVMGFPSFGISGELSSDAFRLFGANMPIDAFRSEGRAAAWRRTIARSGGLFYLPQSFPVSRTQSLKTRTAMIQIIQSMASPRRIGCAEVSHRIGEAFERHAMAATLGKPLGRLSGGERRRAELLARLVAMEVAARPALLVLDEPTTGFDPANAQEFVRDVRDIVDRLAHVGILAAALFSTHEMRCLDDRMDDGRPVVNRLCVVHRDSDRLPDGDTDLCTAVFDGPVASALTSLFPSAPEFASRRFGDVGERVFERLAERPAKDWAIQTEKEVFP